MTKGKRNKQRGIALVTVLIAIAITLVISNDFGTAANTDMVAAANYRDEMRAHFLARSAQNLAELVFQVQAKFDGPQMRQQLGPVQITDFADQIILPFCGDDEQVKDAVGLSTKDVEGLGADIGTCGFNGAFETEDNKINLNCANIGVGQYKVAEMIKSALAALMYFPAYDPIFEEPDAEGWRRDREMQVNSIIDYIDRDTTRGVLGGSNNQGAGGEDYGYESLKDRYVAKNWYVDSLDEVKLARGVDDRFWSLFGSQLTVYGDCLVNLGAVTDPQLIAAILMLATKDTTQPTYQDPRKLFMLAGVVAKAKQFGESFTKAEDFINFVKDPITALGALAGEASMAGSAAGNALTQGLGLPPGEKVGLVIDKSLLDQVATFSARRTYRIEAWGEIERKQKNADGTPLFPPIRKTVTGIWNMGTTLQKSRKTGFDVPKGAWQFLRED
jgi:general secretion pathway protein K